MASTNRKPSKPVYKTARPYSETQWPALTSDQTTNIVDLLCDLLQPLGDHRKTHLPPSRGKKRKRATKKLDAKTDQTPPPPPPIPEISSHILIGLNSVTRHLESLAAQTAPKTAPAHAHAHLPSTHEADEEKEENIVKHSKDSDTIPQKLALVLVPHNHPPASLPHAHIPTLVHLATLNSPRDTATRLLAVPPTFEPRIADALNIPHVGALGVLEGAPGADALVKYVRGEVEGTRCAWVDEAMRPEWKAVRIDGGRV